MSLSNRNIIVLSVSLVIAFALLGWLLPPGLVLVLVVALVYVLVLVIVPKLRDEAIMSGDTPNRASSIKRRLP